jgi:uncharacterized Fe-S center protein
MKSYYLISLLSLILIFGCNSSILDDPSTTIKYSVAEDSHVKLTIENSYKTLISTLVDTVQSAGAHQVSFDANDLAEGVYFYTIEARGTNSDFYLKQTKYILLVK